MAKPVLLACLLALAGCAHQDYRYQPGNAEFATVTTLGARPARSLYGHYDLEMANGQLLGEKQAETISLPPGRHELLFTELKTLELDVEAGRTYYVAWDDVADEMVVHRIEDADGRTVWRLERSRAQRRSRR